MSGEVVHIKDKLYPSCDKSKIEYDKSIHVDDKSSNLGIHLGQILSH